MPELISNYGWARIKQIEPVRELSTDELEKRLLYLGFEGNLLLFESQAKHPGERFIYMLNGKKYFRTSCGEFSIHDDLIELKTQNSKYTFILIHNDADSIIQETSIKKTCRT